MNKTKKTDKIKTTVVGYYFITNSIFNKYFIIVKLSQALNRNVYFIFQLKTSGLVELNASIPPLPEDGK